MQFEVNENEEKGIKEFMEEHKPCYRRTAIGGQFSYMFTPTGIGTGVCVTCNSCGKSKDVTDW